MNEDNKKTLEEIIFETLDENKATDIQVLDIKELTDIAETMIIATANSTTHVKSLTEKVCNKVKSSLNIKPIGVEGEESREWMLADFGDVIVHVMLENVREFYNLEKLWGLENVKTNRENSSS